MTPERWAVIKEVFAEAVGRDPGALGSFLALRCGADIHLRQEVERLLASHRAPAAFIDHSPFDGMTADLVAHGRFTSSTRGHYRLGRRIAVGGMGEVYEAIDVRTDGRVAIKVLSDDAPAASDRLKREARHGSALDHPNICKLLDIGEDDAAPYIAMEFLEGTNLRDAIPEGGFDSATVIELALQLAAAVEHAHARSIIHRDLKSANIMLLADGRLKVLDFGLARRLPREVECAVSVASQTDAGVIAGTLSYLAPEVLKGQRADSRSDIWAFGIVLHELLTGRQPFDGRTPFELTSAILREPPHELIARVPPALRIIRDNCLAKDPAERYQNGADLVAALRAMQSGRRVRRRTSRPISRTTVMALTAMTVCVVLATAWFVIAGRSSTVGHRGVSVAILPFRDLSGESGQGFFGDGIAEALIDRMGTIEATRVFSRESVIRFRNEPSLDAINKALAPNAVVRGSVSQAAGRVQLTVELLDAATGHLVWQQTYARPANEILALENDVVFTVAERLGIPLSTARRSAMRVVRAVDPVVYESYLKGRFQWNRRTTGSLDQAVALFSAAIARDPTYAPAHAALADCYNQLGTVLVGSASPVDMRPRAKAEAISAIQIDDALAEAHATLAYISHYDWDWPTADREFRRALELNPNLALAHAWYSNYLISRDRDDEAVAQVKRAEELDPFSLVVVTNVGWTLSNARRAPEAIAAYRRALAIDPTYLQAHVRLGAELANVGQFDEAIREHQRVIDMTQRSAVGLASLAQTYAKARRRAEAAAALDELLELAKTKYVSPVNLYLTYFLLGDLDNGFVWLEKAFAERSNGLVYLTAEPSLDIVRGDSRFRRAVERVGLPHAS